MTTVNANQYPEFRKQITSWVDTVVSQCDDVWGDQSLNMDAKSAKFATILANNEINL
jgi:hypothetical protein